MNIIIFSHPLFSNSTSMPRFASMIRDGMREKGHSVDVWAPAPLFYKIPVYKSLKKWFGYIDQYIVFPILSYFRIFYTPKNTIFVFSDQALGPWVPLVRTRPHVVHVHDFMALKSSLGEFKQNPTKASGRIYQKFILWGFRHAKRFISVSKRTDVDLARFMIGGDFSSSVIYNGLNYNFRPLPIRLALDLLASVGVSGLSDGYILHVGGNQWYKNRIGVLKIYKAYLQVCKNPRPLLMIGEAPSEDIIDFARVHGIESQIKFVSGLSNQLVSAAYSSASLLLFPSLAEGFGWPIIEAMACGCPVITTNDAPMTEIGREHAFYIPVMPLDDGEAAEWALSSARAVDELLSMSIEELEFSKGSMISYAHRFSGGAAINAYEAVYENCLNEFFGGGRT